MMIRFLRMSLVAASFALTASASATEIGLDQAIEAAVAHSPSARSQADAIAVARSEQIIGRSALRPVLTVTGDLKVWNKAQDVSFTGGGGALPELPAPTTPYEAAISGLLAGFSSPTRLQDQVTGSIGVSITQPLTELVSTRSTREGLALGIDAAEAAHDQAEQGAAIDAISAWLRLHLALAMEGSAQQSVDELAARLKQMDALVAGGAAPESDRLRLQVAQAAALQDHIVARAQVAAAKTMLATLMGLPPAERTDLTPAPVATESCQADDTPLDALVTRALEIRPEFHAAAAGSRQAELGIALAKARMWPSVSAMAAYTHLEGQGLAVKDSAFIGLNLRWNAFEWGRTHEGIAVSKARARQADHQLQALTDGLAMQIEQARQNLLATAEGQQVAAIAERQAAESLRLESARYDAGAATATDVVTAEAALHRARDQRLATGFQCLLARASLRAAVGDPLRASALTTDGGK